jgi:hypothetical protein
LIYFSLHLLGFAVHLSAFRPKELQAKACSNRSQYITAVYQFDEQHSLHITALSFMETSTERALLHPSSLSPTVLNHTLQQTDLNREKNKVFQKT